MDRICEYCGNGTHNPAACPLVRSVEFFPDGTVKRIEKYENQVFVAPSKTSASGEPVGETVRWNDPFPGKSDKEERH